MPALSEFQIENLARPIVAKISEINKFYENPENYRKFREWHIKEYGREPKD